MVFHTCKNIFWPLFLPLFAKFCHLTTSNFSGHGQFFGPLLRYLTENLAIWQHCLLQETREKAADAHTTTSSIWYILNYLASSPWRIPPWSYENRCGCSHSRDPLTGKEDHGETRIFKIFERKLIFLPQINMLLVG
jgi:hypothetical protein